MATSPPVPPSPVPPSPSLDDLLVPPPIPPIINYDFIPDDSSSLDIFPPIIIEPPTHQPANVPPPIEILFPDSPVECYMRGRGRSRSRSRSHSRSRSRSPSICGSRSPSPVDCFPPPPIHIISDCGGPSPGPVYMSPYDTGRVRYPCRGYSPLSASMRSPSPPPRRRRYSYRSRTPSPLRQSFYTQPQIIYPPPPPPMMSMTPPPPPPPIIPPVSCLWPPSAIPLQEPVDILTFQYHNNMAYAPAAKTFDEAIDNVLELWPDLRDFERDRIHLFVGGADQLVRVPKMAWQLVMCDLPRYEIMHIKVDQLPPPPQYQSDGKGIGDEKNEKKKPVRKGGFFSSIKRFFLGKKTQ